MAKFKNEPQDFILRKYIGFFSNVVKNYDEDCPTDDFFNIIRACFDHDKAVELIASAFDEAEILSMSKEHLRRNRLDLDEPLEEVFQSIWNHEWAREKCRVVINSICELIVSNCAKSDNDPTERRFAELKRILKLSDIEAEIMLAAYVRAQTSFTFPCRVDAREKPLYYAMALDRSVGEVSKAMTAKGRLRKFFVLDSDWDFNCRNFASYIDGTDDEAIERRFYRKSNTKDALPWEFYGDLAAKDGELIRSMVKASKGKCNILFYGAPGTGKTSFARTLAREMGLTAFEVRQGDEDGREMRASSRMVGIQIANEQESDGESMLIVDEADELLRSSNCVNFLFGTGGRTTEKGVTNAILDDMKIPAIWISNAPADSMDESVRRRFDYSVCFEKMNSAQRVAIWNNVVARLGLGGTITDEMIATYAEKYQTSAGGITTVLENVKRMKPEAGQADGLIAKLMKPHCQLMGVAEGSKFLPAKGYSLEGLNVKGKVSPEKIVRAVRNYLDAGFNAASEDRPRMNVLLFGPPGTGKTEFVKYLGKALDRKVIVKKGSDILDMYVGQSEQNIAASFRQAERERAILFFDEIDGLVQSREMASQSWQISQVNELLQQMENFDGVMVAATNFCKSLDPAIMRRFTFKLEFDYLDDAGKRAFFEKTFKTTLTEGENAELKALRNLAPGDFRTVRQEHFYLDESQTNLDRIAALREECLIKKDGDTRTPIGFAA